MSPVEQYYSVNGYLAKNVLQHERVLIIGDGFVGRALKAALPKADVLTHKGFVTADVISKETIARMFYVFTMPSITNQLWETAVSKYNVVINTTADTNTSTNLKGCDVELLINTNYTLPITIARECAGQGILFVNISTACLNADIRDARLQHAVNFEQAESPYYASKMLTDAVLRDFQNVITVRPRLIYDDVDTQEQRVERNLTWRVQRYPQLIDCEQSMTHRQTLVAAIIHLSKRWLDDQRDVSNVYDVTDGGFAPLQRLVANDNVKIVRCEQSIESFSPARIVQVDNNRLMATNFAPIALVFGAFHARESVLSLQSVETIQSDDK